jgi:hypothetical protein
MNSSKLIASLLLLTCIVGCGKPASSPPSSTEARSFKATLSLKGLALECYVNGTLYKSTLVPNDKVSPANAVMEVRHGKALEPWCLVDLHMNPSVGMYVAWNPDTGVTHVSPGHTPAINPHCNKLTLVTLFHPHGRPNDIDASEDLYVNGVALGTLPNYNWKVSKATSSRIEWEGMVEYILHTDDYKENTQTAWAETGADLTYCGPWIAPSGKSYNVYFLDHSLKMHTVGLNVHGHQHLYFVRDGKLALKLPCAGDNMKIENNQLLERTGGYGK